MNTGEWPLVPLKAVVGCNDEVLAETFSPENEITYIEISDVDEYDGISWNDPIKFGDAASRARRIVSDGDVLVSTVRTYLRAVASVPDAPSNAIASTGFAVLRPHGINAGFLKYAVLNHQFLDQVIARSVGVSYPAINASELVAIKIALPARETQSRVERFLDQETSEIAAFIADQEELIVLLVERRAAAISHAVTKGLDPAASMKDSGVAWLRWIPAGWRVLSGRRLFDQRKELASFGDEQLAATQEYGVIPQAAYTERSGYRVVEVLKGFEILKRVRPGDFVISMRSFQGGLEYSEYLGKISSAYVMLVPSRPLNDAFFRYLFKCSAYISALRSTSNLVRDGQAMRYSNFAQVHIPIPSLDDQALIAGHLDRETAEIDAAISDAREAIALSKERRAALISAAVTGKIDVRDHGGVE